MARIMTVPAEEARGLRGLIVRMVRRQYGGAVPGIFEVLMPDLRLLLSTGWLYNHLHMRKSSPLTRLQREMLATVVNGAVGGVP